MSSLLWTFLEISVNFFEAFIYLYFSKIESMFVKNQPQRMLYVLFLTQPFFRCTCSLTFHSQIVSAE